MKIRSILMVSSLVVAPSLTAGLAFADTTPSQQPMSTTSQPNHSTAQQGERHTPGIAGPYGLPQSKNANSPDSSVPSHTTTQQGEKNQNTQNMQN